MPKIKQKAEGQLPQPEHAALKGPPHLQASGTWRSSALQLQQSLGLEEDRAWVFLRVYTILL
jgi:hypothetical protein